MAGKAGKAVVAALTMVLLAGPAQAQLPVADPDTAPFVQLFVSPCMALAGNLPGLRQWIAIHHPARLERPLSAPYPGSRPLVEKYDASLATGRHVLVVLPSGACGLDTQAGNAAGIRQALLSLLARQGAIVLPLLIRSRPASLSTQEFLDVAYGRRTWQIEITTRHDPLAPRSPPEVDLLASSAGLLDPHHAR